MPKDCLGCVLICRTLALNCGEAAGRFLGGMSLSSGILGLLGQVLFPEQRPILGASERPPPLQCPALVEICQAEGQNVV